MIEPLKEMLKEVLEDKEVVELAAKLQHKTLLALIDAGFTREEAMKIVVQNGSMIKTNQ